MKSICGTYAYAQPERTELGKQITVVLTMNSDADFTVDARPLLHMGPETR